MQDVRLGSGLGVRGSGLLLCHNPGIRIEEVNLAPCHLRHARITHAGVAFSSEFVRIAS